MKLHTQKIFSYPLLLLIINLPFASAFAANGTLVYAPVVAPAAIPTLGGTMLIVLSLLLFAASFKLAQQKRSSVKHFVVSLLAVGTLLSATGGVKLVSDAQAVSTHPMVAAGGNLPVIGDDLNNYTNNTGVSQEIKSISLPTEEGSSYCADVIPPSSGFPRCKIGILADGASCSIDCNFPVSEGI